MLGNMWYYFFVRKYRAILSWYKFTFSHSGEKKILVPTSLACLVSVLTPWWVDDESLISASSDGPNLAHVLFTGADGYPKWVCNAVTKSSRHTWASSSSELVLTANCADTQLQSARVSRPYANNWDSLWWPLQLLQGLSETKKRV